MSGHNKWSKIKHKKAATDATRSKIFSKLVRLIQVESKRANGDVNDPGLKTVIDKAKKENMPKENIERAIKKGAGGDSGDMESITYEAYGPGGVAMIIEALTDSRNRAAAEVRHILSKNGFELAAKGSATWAFEKVGSEWIPQTPAEITEEDSNKLDNLIEQFDDNDDIQEVFTNAKVI